MNRVNLLGRLTSKPVLRTNESGTSNATFSIAVNDGFGDKQKTYFIPCVAWNKLAETIERYCDKGSQVSVGGKITTNSYETKQGEKRFVVQVSIDECEFLNSKPREAKDDIETKPVSDPFEEFGNEVELSDEDLPF